MLDKVRRIERLAPELGAMLGPLRSRMRRRPRARRPSARATWPRNWWWS